MTENDKPRTDEKRCANCFSCFAETELCPLEPGYDEDKVVRMLEERIKKQAEAKKKDKA